MHGVENPNSNEKLGVNGRCVQLLCLPAWEGDIYLYMYACLGVLSMVCACTVLLL